MKGNPAGSYYELLREAINSGLWPDNLAMLRRIRGSDDLFVLPDVHKIDSVALHYQGLMNQLGLVLKTNHPGEQWDSELRKQLDRLIAELEASREQADQLRGDAVDLTEDRPTVELVERCGTGWKSPEEVIQRLESSAVGRVEYLSLDCVDANEGRNAVGWAVTWRMAVDRGDPGAICSCPGWWL